MAFRAPAASAAPRFSQALKSVSDEAYDDDPGESGRAAPSPGYGQSIAIPEARPGQRQVREGAVHELDDGVARAAQVRLHEDALLALAQPPDDPLERAHPLPLPPLVESRPTQHVARRSGAHPSLPGPGSDDGASRLPASEGGRRAIRSIVCTSGEHVAVPGVLGGRFFKVFNLNRRESIMTQSQDVEVARLRWPDVLRRSVPSNSTEGRARPTSIPS